MATFRFTRRTICSTGLAILVLGTAAIAASAQDQLRIHEWGTFTAMQDETGNALAGINVDDEPVPPFVHNLASFILVKPHALAERQRWIKSKGVPQSHPFVTMRLETPVLYFYPPAGETRPFDVRVDVSIRGGWLTEFYPAANADAPGLKEGSFRFGDITPQTIGRLTWPRVTVGTQASGPVTNSHVWTTPRNVKAASVTVPGKPRDEHERFLFYRGVGNLNVPLRISTNEAENTLSLSAQCGDALPADQSARVDGLWLADVRADGAMAYRALPPIALTPDNKVLATVERSFPGADYSTGNREGLRTRMHAALVAEGLFADEAAAMLDTWQRSYFESAGLRVFFLVPRSWTDFTLPLTISRPADIQRVMIGRIELINSEQRALLKKLATVQISDPRWLDKASQSPNAQKFFAGRTDFGDLGVPIPDDYRTYLNLGRFRNALVLAEQAARPTPQLAQFIKAYGLAAYRPPQTADTR